MNTAILQDGLYQIQPTRTHGAVVHGVTANACEYSTMPLGVSTTRMTAVLLLVTGAVTTSKENDAPPGAIASAAGTAPASESSLDAIEICQPPAGAGASSVPVQLTDEPGFGVVVEHERPLSVGKAITVSRAVPVLPACDAVIVAA